MNFGFNLRERGTLPVGWHIWSIQHQIMPHFSYLSCPTFLTIHDFTALVVQLCEGMGFT